METSRDSELLEQLHGSLSPKGFEFFVKDILKSIGFDDVEVTGGPRDSGVDLTATLRKSEIPGIDTNISYIIQAKRFDPKRTLNPIHVRGLRGTMQSGQRGVLITTCRVSRNTMEKESLKDPSRVVLVIEGSKLIELCKSKGVGLVARHEIDEEYLASLEASESETEGTKLIGSKLVTQNDIRARILRIPKEVKQQVSGKTEVTLHFDDGTKQSLRLDSEGTYLGGVTNIYRKYGLIDDKGNAHEMFSEWELATDGFVVRFLRQEERPNISAILESIFKSRFVRIPGTSIFFGAHKKFLCRYSKFYGKQMVYWYGITPKDVHLIREQSVSKLAFFCSTTMMVFIDSEHFLRQLDNLNVTESEPGVVRHYHVFFRQKGKNLLWVLKGGATIKLTNEVVHLAPQSPLSYGHP